MSRSITTIGTKAELGIEAGNAIYIILREVQEAASSIQEQAHDDANIIFGASIDEEMMEAIKVTVIATGFGLAEETAVVDVAREASRSDERGLRDGIASVSRAAASSSRELLLPRADADVVPAYAGRRSASGGSLVAHHSSHGPLQVRERIPFPSSSESRDWDTPAYQRRQSSD